MEAAKLKEKVVFVLVVACMSCPLTDITSTWREDTSASSPGCLLVTLPEQGTSVYLVHLLLLNHHLQGKGCISHNLPRELKAFM